MTTLYLVRHGEAAAGFGDHHDPGLSPRGRDQALAVAHHLATVFADCGNDSARLPELRCSPLRRCMETAAPIGDLLLEHRIVDPAVAEIPSPTDELSGRAAWLGDVLGSTWSSLGRRERLWRQSVLDHLGSLSRDAVVVTHFVPINIVIGEATGSDAVTVARCANASITVVDVVGDGSLRLVTEGEHGASEVL